jgi:heat-inducible transcriptional repressor
MNPRTREVLHEIVEAYIETGDPVASRAISKRWGAGLSAASIRNIMVDLDEEGYLSQPHTSAGRIPTEKAFRSYVQTITLRRMAGTEYERLRQEIGKLTTVEDRIEFSSRVLTDITRGMGIAAVIWRQSPALAHVELIGLPDQKVLMVLVAHTGEVYNHIVKLDEPVGQDELASIRNYINHNFAGWTLEAMRGELARRLEHESAAYDDILRTLTVLYSKGLLEVSAEPEVHAEGVSNLVGVDLHLTRERMRELLRALEEKKRVLALVNRFLEQPLGEVGVHVGLKEMHPTMSELSLIGTPVKLEGGREAVIAVLGPMRMNYARTMGAVRDLSQVFS